VLSAWAEPKNKTMEEERKFW